MDISLIKAKIKDAETIHHMQIKAFRPLLERYKDFEINPANEPIEKVIGRINHPSTDYYIVKSDGIVVGGIRIIKRDNKSYGVSTIFILPEYQEKGIAQKVFQIIEQIYYDAIKWELSTILQERGNCYLYEKLGYEKTGKMQIINSNMTLVFYEKYFAK
ncbi:GNAT family N-acetyltransferase [Clostridium sp.]|jgi:GNAT superfamily N-acetyltransferase|uniref:GNAT family N-acetyltransferase n=1 Tax=Clostridium sp. TaxID=1506 RepID=UPI0025854D3B|nr:GNAT family N-acetyltransferase [Clostridium sp.]MDF2506077.1 acetyltransferase [Clostridium sp.]